MVDQYWVLSITAREFLWTSLLAGMMLGAFNEGAFAQEVEVSLLVTEDTPGIIRSEFGAALRRLGDVKIVTIEESPNVILRVVSMCLPRSEQCGSATQYSLAISLSEPISHSFVTNVPSIADSSVELSDDATLRLWSMLKGFEIYRAMWTALWGRDRYRMAVAEKIAEIDSKCFEKHRLFARWSLALREKGVAGARPIMDRMEDGDWVC